MSALDVSGRWRLPPLRPGTAADEELTARRAMVAGTLGVVDVHPNHPVAVPPQVLLVLQEAEKFELRAVPGVVPVVWPSSWTVANIRPSGATAIAEIG